MERMAVETKPRIGPAGWSYEDWKGIVYPSGAGRRFDPLEYLCGFFDVIEINSSFYRPPPPQWNRGLFGSSCGVRLPSAWCLARNFTSRPAQNAWPAPVTMPT